MDNPCKKCNIQNWTDFEECYCQEKFLYECGKEIDVYDLDKVSNEIYDLDKINEE